VPPPAEGHTPARNLRGGQLCILAEQRDARGRWLPGATPLGARPWRKGQVPNPSGQSGLYHEIVCLAREAAPNAIRRLIELIRNEDERVASVACNAVLERAFGKPKEYDPASEKPEEEPFDPRAYTPEDLAVIEP
jgi:hypothetical protein